MPGRTIGLLPFLAVVVALLASWLWLTATPSAEAHALVIGPALQEHPLPAQTATTVTLRFNVAIEAKFMKIFLVDAGGAKRPLVFAPGARPGEVVVHLPPLPPGAYGLLYTVLATDGHLTENVVRFRIAAP